MAGTSPRPSDADDHRHLPEPVALKDTITSHDVVDAPDPTMGRDTETEWLLRNAAG